MLTVRIVVASVMCVRVLGDVGGDPPTAQGARRHHRSAGRVGRRPHVGGRIARRRQHGERRDRADRSAGAPRPTTRCSAARRSPTPAPACSTTASGCRPGTSITGFPPGIVTPPAIIDATTRAAAQAQLDLTAAYLDAAGRPLNATTTADLAGLTLVGGVYAGPSKSPLSLTGTLVLDGEGNPNSVFIFQTDSTLITGSASTVSLINGAQECNVFWQVGSSATLGTGSVFVGNILALTSISVTTGVTVHGRALARNGAVTLDNDIFTSPTCDLTTPVTTTTTAWLMTGHDGSGRHHTDDDTWRGHHTHRHDPEDRFTDRDDAPARRRPRCSPSAAPPPASPGASRCDARHASFMN